MARIRTLKPSFWTDEKLTQLSRDVRLTFLGLISHADDSGRLKGDPRLIKAAIYPLDDDITADSVKEHLRHLARAGLIVRYTAGQFAFIELPNFTRHQQINKARASEIPPPPEAENTAREESGSTPGGIREHSREEWNGMEEEWNGGGARGAVPDGTPPDMPAVEVPEAPSAAGGDSPRPASKHTRSAAGTPSKSRTALPEWVAAGVALWTAHVGHTTPERIRRCLSPAVEGHGWPRVEQAISYYAAIRQKDGRTAKLEWFRDEAVTWMDRADDEHRIIGANGNEAEMMAYITSPEYLRGGR